MFNHDEITPRIAIDLDGILCVDPTQEQNDDGKNSSLLINIDLSHKWFLRIHVEWFDANTVLPLFDSCSSSEKI